MKKLESLKGNKFNTESVKGGAQYIGNMAEQVHMTASYTRPEHSYEFINGGLLIYMNNAATSGDPGYSNVVDR